MALLDGKKMTRKKRKRSSVVCLEDCAQALDSSQEKADG